MSGADLLLALVKAVVLVWDLLTWPLYQALQRPWEKRKGFSTVKAKVVRSSAEEVVYECPEKHSEIDDDMTR